MFIILIEHLNYKLYFIKLQGLFCYPKPSHIKGLEGVTPLKIKSCYFYMYQDKKKAPKWGLFAGLSAPFS